MPYRVEAAKTGRAGCQNKECKDAKVKIAKGELRLGTWVDNDRIQAWMWRHWGCTTPKLISNIKESIGEGEDMDLDALDGYDELEAGEQEKIQRAFEQGHVDDEDWKGDVEVNRPGSTGFRKRISKKAAKKDEAASEDEEKPAPKPKASGRGKAQKKDASPEPSAEEKQPTPKKTSTPRGRPKKVVAEPEPEAESEPEEEKPTPKTRPARRGKKAPEEEVEAQPEQKKPAAKRGRPSTKAAEEPVANSSAKRQRRSTAAEEVTTEPAVAERPKRQRRSTAAAEEDVAEPAVAEKPKRGRKKKST
ncbi:zf-PARP-domain-containing protein [Aspergillus campestris IBT 28561]|uniref:Zf-PARP-domain-containing protein n=1 Tax=Aspergillus campestris (strain IBT 28561) TaxID=1392248 RepID=A0A2I1DF57_ASPC2|nr:zf-PARP-domain-containing protein [Aspergillus campestris IBT 28561]PKY08513.1 zf-PARP-domain-containing protein [Aspergillus campestris IBT 28561]